MRASVVVLAVLTLLAARDGRAAQALDLHYDVYFLHLPILSIDVESHLSADDYRTSAALKTSGVLAALANWESQLRVSGRVDGAMLHPAHYRADSRYRDRQQAVDLSYGDAGAVRGDVNGVLTDGERDDVSEALRLGTVDPLTANVILATRLAATGSCVGTIAVFDGLRRYDLDYDDRGTVELEPSTLDDYQGSAHECRATVRSMAGFLRTGEHAGERATEIETWLASPLPGAAPVAVRMDLVGSHGTLHVHLRRATQW